MLNSKKRKKWCNNEENKFSMIDSWINFVTGQGRMDGTTGSKAETNNWTDFEGNGKDKSNFRRGTGKGRSRDSHPAENWGLTS